MHSLPLVFLAQVRSSVSAGPYPDLPAEPNNPEGKNDLYHNDIPAATTLHT